MYAELEVLKCERHNLKGKLKTHQPMGKEDEIRDIDTKMSTVDVKALMMLTEKLHKVTNNCEKLKKENHAFKKVNIIFK